MIRATKNLLVAAVLAPTGCQEPDLVCDAAQLKRQARSLEALTGGSFELSPTSRHVRQKLRVRLFGLSDQGLTRVDASSSVLSLTFTTFYTEPEPEGAPLPVVSYSGRVTSGADFFISSSDGVVSLTLPIFECESDVDCCPAGETECSTEITINVSRSDVLYPETTTEFAASAAASVNSCTDNEPGIEIVLEGT